MTEIERRFTPGVVEVRAAAADKRTIGGYAAKHNKPSRNLGGFVEQIDPAAFRKSRGDGWPDVMARYNHDDAMMLGTTGARTLRLDLDETGLTYEVDLLPGHQIVYDLIQRGDVKQSSFAFRTMPEGDEWGLTEEKFPLRTLHAVQLVDVAPVNSPAYPDTTAVARALKDPTKPLERGKLDTREALRSLAEHMSADPAEIADLAQAGDLAKLFKRSDGGPAPTVSGIRARMDVLARREPPWAS